MVNIIIQLSKYVIIILMAAYTFSCFSIFTRNYEDEEKRVLIRQDVLMFLLQFAAFGTMYLATKDIRILFLYAVLTVILLAVILLYNLIYPNVSRLVVNNMCMLITVGMIMITRLSADNPSPYGTAVRQLVFVALGITFGLVVPVLIRKMKFLDQWTYIYAAVGGAALLAVALFAQISGGAKLGFEIAGINIQPSEFVKIIFVFFVAASLNKSKEFKNIVVTTAIAAAHVLILVLSTDLGAALIFFVVYLVMLFVATRQWLYAIAGLGAGAAAAVVGYHLFSHIQVRVEAWQDPIGTYSGSGYQVAQSLFAIGTGSWFGTGLFKGQPDTIPVSETDFIFSAITEEMGVIYALCLILICVSCYVMFLNIAMELRNNFYKLIALGLGTCYIFQVFLQIGGVTKFIPSTGMTLPFVSYGGSSMLSTMIMFGIIQGLYIIREDEEEEREKEKLRKERKRKNGVGRTAPRKTAKDRKFEEVPRQRPEKKRERAQNRDFAKITYFFVVVVPCVDGVPPFISHLVRAQDVCEQPSQSNGRILLHNSVVRGRYHRQRMAVVLADNGSGRRREHEIESVSVRLAVSAHVIGYNDSQSWKNRTRVGRRISIFLTSNAFFYGEDSEMSFKETKDQRRHSCYNAWMPSFSRRPMMRSERTKVRLVVLEADYRERYWLWCQSLTFDPNTAC